MTKVFIIVILSNRTKERNKRKQYKDIIICDVTFKGFKTNLGKRIKSVIGRRKSINYIIT